jgi:hypothetical protein
MTAKTSKKSAKVARKAAAKRVAAKPTLLPAGSETRATAGPEGCRMWVKTGHLAGPSPRQLL